MITVVIGEATPSLNETLRMHWARRRAMATQWSFALAIGFSAADASKANGKRKLTIERRGRRLLDEDNLAGGCKFVIDAVKKLGYLVDDDPAWLELVVTQSTIKRADSPHTVLTLCDVL